MKDVDFDVDDESTLRSNDKDAGIHCTENEIECSFGILDFGSGHICIDVNPSITGRSEAKQHPKLHEYRQGSGVPSSNAMNFELLKSRNACVNIDGDLFTITQKIDLNPFAF